MQVYEKGNLMFTMTTGYFLKNAGREAGRARHISYIFLAVSVMNGLIKIVVGFGPEICWPAHH